MLCLLTFTARFALRWLGLILLPLVSFAGDGFVAVGYFLARLFRYKTVIPEELAKGRAIDMSIQFLTLWLPFLVLLSWWIDKPLSLLFGTLERLRGQEAA